MYLSNVIKKIFLLDSERDVILWKRCVFIERFVILEHSITKEIALQNFNACSDRRSFTVYEKNNNNNMGFFYFRSKQSKHTKKLKSVTITTLDFDSVTIYRCYYGIILNVFALMGYRLSNAKLCIHSSLNNYPLYSKTRYVCTFACEWTNDVICLKSHEWIISMKFSLRTNEQGHRQAIAELLPLAPNHHRFVKLKYSIKAATSIKDAEVIRFNNETLQTVKFSIFPILCIPFLFPLLYGEPLFDAP